jgi:DNA invertase Pin-like site-specific DNA recombinase
VLIGYMRVSTADQNHDLQRDALRAAGCERCYEDTCSGTASERPGLSRALDAVRADGALVGAEGPSARKRTVAYCTQCYGWV